MIRRNREINIFNMSALDLFASALGAFIILFVVLMPYYLKTSRTMSQENTALRSDLSALQSAVETSRQEQQDIQAERAQLQNFQQKLQDENHFLKEQLQQAQANLKQQHRFALLGINTRARSFVVLVDMSGSMVEYTSTARKTIQRLLEPMGAGHKVQIIGFREEYKDYPELESWVTPHQLAAMDNINKVAARRFSEKLASKFDGGTPTLAALREALKYNADAIILLTDGAPTDSKPSNIIDTITKMNGKRKEIHTVAIGDYNAEPILVDFLQKLAAKNNGAFVGAAK